MQTGVICNTSKLRSNGFGFIKPDNGKDLPVWRISWCPYTPQAIWIHTHVIQTNYKLHTAHTHRQTLRTAFNTHIVGFKNMRDGNVFRWWERFLSHTWQGQQKCQGPVRRTGCEIHSRCKCKGRIRWRYRPYSRYANVPSCSQYVSMCYVHILLPIVVLSQCTTLPHTCPLIRARLHASRLRRGTKPLTRMGRPTYPTSRPTRSRTSAA